MRIQQIMKIIEQLIQTKIIQFTIEIGTDAPDCSGICINGFQLYAFKL